MKKIPFWLKTGVLLPVILFTLFLISGLIIAFLNNGGCYVPGKYYFESFEQCIIGYDNPMIFLFLLPAGLIGLILLSIGLINSINIIFFLILSIILWFFIGSVLGFVFNKIKLKK
jgi:hypothetical protein